MSSSDGKDGRSQQPADTAFRQQRLPAWRPILNAGSAAPLFAAIAIVFIPVGIVILVYSSGLEEISIDYTACQAQYVSYQVNGTNTNYQPVSGDLNCDKYVNSSSFINTTCLCTIIFTLPVNFPTPVYLYYGLTNYYQNHRRYVRSRDDNQILGRVTSPSSLSTDCDPYRSSGSNGYTPCGAIANSMFMDRFTLYYTPNMTSSVAMNIGSLMSEGVKLKLNKKGIAWASDKASKFIATSSGLTLSEWLSPPSWQNGFNFWNFGYDSSDTSSSDTSENGYQNEDLMVWMRTAALPTFRKLHRFIDPSPTGQSNMMPMGQYGAMINYSYPVADFGGTKRFIIATSNSFGGGGLFLGILYVVIGTICLILSLICIVVHCLMLRNLRQVGILAIKEFENASKD